MLNKQRREKPLAQAGHQGRPPRRGPPLRRRRGSICTGDHACIRLSGLPLPVAETPGRPPPRRPRRLDRPVLRRLRQLRRGRRCRHPLPFASTAPTLIHNPTRWERRLAAKLRDPHHHLVADPPRSARRLDLRTCRMTLHPTFDTLPAGSQAGRYHQARPPRRRRSGRRSPHRLDRGVWPAPMATPLPGHQRRRCRATHGCDRLLRRDVPPRAKGTPVFSPDARRR